MATRTFIRIQNPRPPPNSPAPALRTRWGSSTGTSWRRYSGGACADTACAEGGVVAAVSACAEAVCGACVYHHRHRFFLLPVLVPFADVLPVSVRCLFHLHLNRAARAVDAPPQRARENPTPPYGNEWTPQRVALPTFADLKRRSRADDDDASEDDAHQPRRVSGVTGCSPVLCAPLITAPPPALPSGCSGLGLLSLKLLEAIGVLTKEESQKSQSRRGVYQEAATESLSVERDNEATQTDDVPDLEGSQPVSAIGKAILKLRKIEQKELAATSPSSVSLGELDTNNEKVLMLILDVKTRWSSSHQMLRRALQFRGAIFNYVAKDEELRAHELSTRDWTALKLVTNWLVAFREATTQILNSHDITPGPHC
ncbi:Transposase-like protein [Mycena venus]|uniref:Transposase-like protein n=1 Tax=Mycena venus TaxID=2733690 RepID=A0A8H6Z6F9_9AGAR|nr:Transposase-like protein [Mycena venus]